MADSQTADIAGIIDRYDGDPGMLIPMMQDVQAECGYLPQSELKKLAGQLALPLSRVYSVAGFYSSFRLMPKGDHTVQLCLGTVCFLKGAAQISQAIQQEFGLVPGGTSPDRKFTFCPVNCVGACALAPVMVVDGEYHGGVTVDSALELLHKIAAQSGAQAAAEDSTKPPQKRETVQEAGTWEQTEVISAATRLENPSELDEFRQALRAEQDPKARRVRICIGTGCTAKGALRVVEQFRKAADAFGDQSLVVETKCTGCHGFCERGPIVVVDPGNIFYQNVMEEDVPEVWRESVLGGRLVDRLLYQDEATQQTAATPEEIPFYRGQQRVVLALNGVIDPKRIEEYIAAGGYAALAKVLTSLQPEEVIAEITRSGLRGRGGGGFPTGRKWQSAAMRRESRST